MIKRNISETVETYKDGELIERITTVTEETDDNPPVSLTHISQPTYPYDPLNQWKKTCDCGTGTSAINIDPIQTCNLNPNIISEQIASIVARRIECDSISAMHIDANGISAKILSGDQNETTSED